LLFEAGSLVNEAAGSIAVCGRSLSLNVGKGNAEIASSARYLLSTALHLACGAYARPWRSWSYSVPFAGVETDRMQPSFPGRYGDPSFYLHSPQPKNTSQFVPPPSVAKPKPQDWIFQVRSS
jgi:hypothetical protein